MHLLPVLWSHSSIQFSPNVILNCSSFSSCQGVVFRSQVCIKYVHAAFDHSHLQCLSLFGEAQFLQVAIGGFCYGAQCTYNQRYYFSRGAFSLSWLCFYQLILLLLLLFRLLVEVSSWRLIGTRYFSHDAVVIFDHGYVQLYHIVPLESKDFGSP